MFYEIKQLNDKRIKKIFHENYLKQFVFKTKHLSNFFDFYFSQQQIIRNKKIKTKSSTKHEKS